MRVSATPFVPVPLRKAVKNGVFFHLLRLPPGLEQVQGTLTPVDATCEDLSSGGPMFRGRNVARSHPHVSPTLEQGVEREGREGTFSTTTEWRGTRSRSGWVSGREPASRLHVRSHHTKTCM